MPLLRGAMIGGTAYAVGRRSANSTQREADQSAAISALQAEQAQQAQQAQIQAAQRQPSTGQADGTDVASRLSQLGALLQQGMLTQEEFARAKAQLLGT
jgi:membrane protease subunit (stomatin/prohibitin family)